PFDIGSPTDSGTDTSEPPWNPLDNLDMETQTQPDPPMELPFGIFDSDPNNGLISPAQRAANQRALAHGDVPADFTGNVPLTAQQQLDDAQWHIDRLRDVGYSDNEILEILSDLPDYSFDTDGGVLAGMLSAAEEAARRSSGAVGNPGRHSSVAAEALAASRSLSRLARSLPFIGAAVSVADGAMTLKDGGAIPETVSAVTGGIAAGFVGAWVGTQIGQEVAGAPGAIIGIGLGGVLGAAGAWGGAWAGDRLAGLGRAFLGGN
ncbi:MAG: hypothetical protein U5O16_23570, partial [Rhodococcus sp. (in: high G+C Gram-positive bacteria)]|nr:hypothetical protein [Rhodococcus sp. (in: high G+C Gram-positive bacteria)]